MGFFELVKSRRSVRKFNGSKIPLSRVNEILEAGRWAPSGGNAQPWRFVVIANEGLIRALKTFSPGLLDTPPVIVVLCLDAKGQRAEENSYLWLDVGAAMQNMLLAAHSLEVGCCVVGSFNKRAVAELLDLPAAIEPLVLVAMGHAREQAKPGSRMPLDKLIQATYEDETD